MSRWDWFNGNLQHPKHCTHLIPTDGSDYIVSTQQAQMQGPMPLCIPGCPDRASWISCRCRRGAVGTPRRLWRGRGQGGRGCQRCIFPVILLNISYFIWGFNSSIMKYRPTLSRFDIWDGERSSCDEPKPYEIAFNVTPTCAIPKI